MKLNVAIFAIVIVTICIMIGINSAKRLNGTSSRRQSNQEEAFGRRRGSNDAGQRQASGEACPDKNTGAVGSRQNSEITGR